MKKLHSYDIGDKINHTEFGIGRIVGITQRSDALIWKVVFQDIGEKNIEITEDQLIIEEEKTEVNIDLIKKAVRNN